MKSTLFFVLLIFVSLTWAQSDSLWVEMDGDTIKIWNTQIDENCAFFVHTHVYIYGDSISIIEHDQATEMATCTCFFDICVKLTNLITNNYKATVHRRYSAPWSDPDSLYYIGTTYFSYSKTSAGQLSTAAWQSDCYYPQSIEEREAVPESAFLLDSYPNPFNPRTTILVTMPETLPVQLQLYDLNGKRLKTISDRTLSAGEHRFDLDASHYASSHYIVSLESGKRILKSLRISLVK